MHSQSNVTLKGQHVEASAARNRSSWDVRTYLHRMEQPVATTHFGWRTTDDLPTDSWFEDLYPDEVAAFDAATRLLTAAVSAGPDRTAVNNMIEAFCNGEAPMYRLDHIEDAGSLPATITTPNDVGLASRAITLARWIDGERLAHADAWALKQALWVKGASGKLTGKSGRNYLPAVAEMLAAAYPLPEGATDLQAAAIRTKRSRLYSVIDDTTADRLGMRADRKVTRPKGSAAQETRACSRIDLGAAWEGVSIEYDTAAKLIGDAVRAAHKNDRTGLVKHLGDASKVLRERKALDRLGNALELEAE